MKSMKKVLALVLALTMVLTLAACGGSSAGTGNGAASGTASVLEVKIWDNNQLAGLQQIADEWSAQSGVKVNIQVVTWDDYWTLLEAGASGGEMPDVFWMHSNNAQMYMEHNKLLDLTDYVAKSDVVDLSNYYQGVTELYSLNGKQYAIAKDHDTIAVIYNKAIFDQYGVEYPTDDWTWEDFYEISKTITAASNGTVYGCGFNTNNDQDSYFNIIYDYGGCVISPDRKKSGWDDPNTRAAMAFVGKCMTDAFAPQTMVSENGVDTLFANGKLAMSTQGSWMINYFYTQENSADYAWAMLPYYDANQNGQCDAGERTSMYNGLGWAASADTKDKDAAWSLIEWFSSKENQLKQSELGVTMAGYIGCSEAFSTAFPGMNIDAFINIENEGTLIFRPYSKYTSRWTDQYHKELVEAWRDPSKMDDVLTNLAREMNDLLAQE